MNQRLDRARAVGKFIGRRGRQSRRSITSEPDRPFSIRTVGASVIGSPTLKRSIARGILGVGQADAGVAVHREISQQTGFGIDRTTVECGVFCGHRHHRQSRIRSGCTHSITADGDLEHTACICRRDRRDRVVRPRGAGNNHVIPLPLKTVVRIQSRHRLKRRRSARPHRGRLRLTDETGARRKQKKIRHRKLTGLESGIAQLVQIPAKGRTRVLAGTNVRHTARRRNERTRFAARHPVHIKRGHSVVIDHRKMGPTRAVHHHRLTNREVFSVTHPDRIGPQFHGLVAILVRRHPRAKSSPTRLATKLTRSRAHKLGCRAVDHPASTYRQYPALHHPVFSRQTPQLRSRNTVARPLHPSS